jgi:glycosyltransferase involved in cell wall biosynthesis
MIAIAMATYNGEKYLKEQIDSILEQSYNNWVLYIHDDNSQDNTVSIIKEYQLKYSNKIVFLDDDISFGNPQDNFSYIITKIPESYEYYMFSDQDDFWLENKIEITLKKNVRN